MKARRSAAAVVRAAVVVTCATAGLAHGADGTWIGAGVDALWPTAGNWDLVPGGVGTTNNQDTATFNGAPAQLAVTVDAGRNVKGITFDNTAVGFTIGSNAGETLLLSGGGVLQATESVTATGTSTQVLASPVMFAGSTYTFTNNAPSSSGMRTTGAMTASSGTPVTLTLNGTNNAGATTSVSQVNSAIADGASGGVVTIVKDGSGTWELNGTNTYSGDTIVNGGILRFNGANASSPNTRLIVNNGGRIRFSVLNATSHSLEIRSGGTADTSDSSRTQLFASDSGPALYLNYSSAPVTTYFTSPFNLTGTVAGEGGIKMSATPQQAAANLGGTSTPLDLGTVIRPFDIQRGDPAANTSYDLRVRGPISGNGGGILKLGDGILRLDNANLSFTGPIEVREGEFRINNSDVLQGNNALTVSGGTFRVTGGQTFRFASATITKGTIAASNNASTVRAPSFDFNVAAGDTATADTVLADLTTGTTVNKTGAGVATLAGINTYTGVTTVDGGKLVLKGSGARAPVIAGAGADVKSGTLSFDYDGANGGGTVEGQIVSLLQAGYATGWAAPAQIRSSTADATHGIGYVDDGNAVNVVRTLYGDINLDGLVNRDDIAQMDRAVAKGLGTAWTAGNFDYDSDVDTDDVLLLDKSFIATNPADVSGLLAEREAQFGSEYVSQLVAAVPEPTSVGLLLVAGGLLGRRRREK